MWLTGLGCSVRIQWSCGIWWLERIAHCCCLHYSCQQCFFLNCRISWSSAGLCSFALSDSSNHRVLPSCAYQGSYPGSQDLIFAFISAIVDYIPPYISSLSSGSLCSNMSSLPISSRVWLLLKPSLGDTGLRRCIIYFSSSACGPLNDSPKSSGPGRLESII